jgi:hypothetical protein
MDEIISFNERLGITEEKKSEITNNLGSFLKYLSNHYNLSEISTEKIAGWWLKYVEKPGWVRNKLQEDVEFIANICSFIEKHKAFADKYEGNDNIKIKFKSQERRKLEIFLSTIKNDKTEEPVDWEEVEKMSDRQLKEEISKYFYLNNQYDTLGDNPLM